ncbi:MAG: class I SAM-dependent methyltransferase [Candidatus Eisenbacteria bacterium]|jgi:SAM-dependent methyltransferase|nr:class I SAM-dependent methyltransferase [Candidatus Eisenbacteria bacterium]
MMLLPARDVISHYSDPRIAEAFHADRYGGPVGALFLSQETRQFHALACRFPHPRIVVDLGAGTGKLADTIGEGARYVAMDRSAEMLRVLRARRTSTPLVAGDAHTLPFRSKSVDVLVASRLLMHLADWRTAVAETCRVARCAVIVDFPVSPSFAALEPGVWSLCRRDSHPRHRVFSVADMRRAFAAAGFLPVDSRRGFVLPYRLHRFVGSPRFSRAIESVATRLGLAHLIGSPAFVAFVPTSAAGDGGVT